LREHPPIDLADRPPWDQHVLEAVTAVPWGTTASDGEIARRIGAPRASRAVGGALGRNPVSFMIPCHRIIAADGTLGGWGGDRWGDQANRLRNKQDLLLREGVTVAPRAG
jgi:O-6-methylguanine DNA methyltransferase